MGIPQEKQPEIFEMFRQLENAETRKFGGLGGGLFIVKKFTEMLGGTVTVESTLNRGSTFTVAIPLELQARNIPCSPPDSEDRKTRNLRTPG